jgi:trehalose-6-phosphatase
MKIKKKKNLGMPMKKFKNLIQLPPDVHEALKVLSNEPNCVVIITTTHPPQVLERLFGDTRVCLAAEKGCIYR